jgi:hypothetical protein
LIDEVVSETPNARVFHEPASGSPGRPRNVGLANAAGEFVFFSDHDDWFEPHALERMVGCARQHDSDVVIGKVVPHGRRAAIPRLFRTSRARLPAAEAMISLTPHKLFRRDFLERHQIRYLEGKRRLEDHHFVTHAYLHAGTISVYADQVCYHHNDPGAEANFSQTVSDPALYIGSNREVIELIRRHTDSDLEWQYDLLARPVLHELVYKAAPGQLGQRDAEGEARKHDSLRDALREAVPGEVVDQLPPFPRATARALLRDDADAVRRISERASRLALSAELTSVQASGTSWQIGFDGVLTSDGEPLVLSRAPGKKQWLVADGPASDEVTGSEAELLDIDLEVYLRNRDTEVPWHLPATCRTTVRRGRLPFAAAAATLRISGRAVVDLESVGDEPIADGIWDLFLRADVLGVGVRTRLVAPGGNAGSSTLPRVRLHGSGRVAAAFTTARQVFAIDVGGTRRARR